MMLRGRGGGVTGDWALVLLRDGPLDAGVVDGVGQQRGAADRELCDLAFGGVGHCGVGATEEEEAWGEEKCSGIESG